MNTVRISRMEVQVGFAVYQFLNAELADSFFEIAEHGSNVDRAESKSLALGSRPVDCDHELGTWHD
jgi:3-phenylpropionate/cinnamic acid dioxygenase small subunit